MNIPKCATHKLNKSFYKKIDGVWMVSDVSGKWLESSLESSYIEGYGVKIAGDVESTSPQAQDNTVERRVEDRRMSSGEKILRTQLYQAQSKICELEEEIKSIKSAPVPPQTHTGCDRCGCSTVEYCDEIGCGFLGAGNGEPQADAGEVERLRLELELSHESHRQTLEERDTLRAQLAERDALLRECAADLEDWCMAFPEAYAGVTDTLVARIDSALSASAEPNKNS